MTAATTTLDQPARITDSNEDIKINPLAYLWLGLMTACLGGTLLCTTVLISWPLIVG